MCGFALLRFSFSLISSSFLSTFQQPGLSISLCEGTFSLLLWDVWPEYPTECAFFHSNRSILHYVFNTSYPTECCFLSFKSIHPSLCIQHILPYCVCGMRTAEGRSMLLDLLSFIRFNHQYAFMTST